MAKDTSQQPFISFVVTCYNLPLKLLTDCLDSILALPLEKQEREIIVVDDGSEQSLLNQMGPLLDHIVYVRQQNQGLSGARNTGLNMCRGTYVQFVDGDDMLIREGYTHCIDLLRKDCQLDMLLFESTSEQTGGGMAITDDAPESGAEYMRHNNLHGSACSYLFRREAAGRLRFTPGILHEDEEFTPQLVLRADKLQHTSSLAYYYRRRENSIMRNTDSQHIERRLNDQEAVICRLNAMADRMPTADKSAMQRRVHQLTMDYLYNTIILTANSQQLEMRIERLKGAGLFPLPDKDYTRKYKWFRLMTKNKMARKMLVLALTKKR